MPGVPISQLIPSSDNTVDVTDLIPAARSGVGTIKIPGAAFINTVSNAGNVGTPLVGTQTYSTTTGYDTPIKTLLVTGGLSLISSNNTVTIDGSSISNLFIERAGDTMTGDLVLNADPTLALQAATKQYVDTKTSSLSSTVNSKFLPLSGGTLTGALALNAKPTLALQAATKQYVDGVVSLSATGYQVFSSGLIIQWGSGTTSSNDITITLPITFPNELFQAQGHDAGILAGGSTQYLLNWYTNGTTKEPTSQVRFTINSGNPGSLSYYTWMAIGY